MIGWLWTAVALGCGGMFGPVDGEVFSDAQQVLFELGSDTVQVEYLVDYAGDQADFGWVIPIPGTFVGLDEGDTERFDALRWDTLPEIEYVAEGTSGNCAPATKGEANLAGGRSGDLTVVASGRAGVFEFTVIEADSAVPLTLWLEDNGWDVGPSFPAIEEYVLEGGWQFVAISLSEDVPAETADGAGQSVARISYEGASMRFPARMSRYSMAPEQKTTIYVVGDQRATMTGWDVTDLPGGEYVGYWDFNDGVRVAAAEQARYAVTFADELDGQWVTRFDTITDSDKHEADPQLLLDGGIVTYRPDLIVYESGRAFDEAHSEGGCATARSRAAIGWVLLAAIAIRRRR